MSRLSLGADLAWRFAAGEANGARHARIETGHLLIGLLSLEKLRKEQAGSFGLNDAALAGIRSERAEIASLLAAFALDAGSLRRALRRGLGEGPGGGSGALSRSPACKAAFARAEELAAGRGANALHLLVALLESPEPPAREALADQRVDLDKLLVRARAFALAAEPAAPAGPPAAAPERIAVPAAVPSPVPPAGADGGTPMLDRYSRDLTALAARGELGPVIGRRAELLRLLQTLARSSKNNPVLVGEAGVGKTAIVEALAIRAAQGKDPAVLGGKRIVELSLGGLLGGTEMRGELEKRLTRILEETRARPELIVFIDELHTVVGAGRASGGSADVANLIKPALARGELRVIGATTIAEYRSHVESDPALERRFEKIDVPEPSEAETLEILRGLREKWQRHHGVRIEDAALEAAVPLSVRFDPEHRLPDKAVDLVDKAAARARVPMLSMRAPDPKPTDAEAPAAPAPSSGPRVDARLVAEVLAEKRGLPLELVSQEGLERGARLLRLEPFLRERLIGQQPAIARVAARVQLAHSGLGERRGPLGVFLFLGPTGVGKTELARLLAEFLFGSAEALTRFDMSELQEEHSVAKLIGAPPGYVGHEEEGRLVSALRSKPYSVVLLDEAEKAHPRVFDLFLQVFDAGRVTDARGRSADARHALFVLTSNLGSQLQRERMGFAAGEPAALDAARTAALEEARRFFRPELLNRVDELLVFDPLGPDSIRAILGPLLGRLAQGVRERHGVGLRVDPQAEEFLARAGFSPAQGARELRRTVERLVEAPLANLALSGKLARHAAWRLVYDEGGVYLLPDEA